MSEPARTEAGIASRSPEIPAVPARPEHLESLVDCHLAALPGDFVPSLGRRFVRLHDRFYMDQPDGVVLVTLDPASGGVSGFIIGGSPAVRPRFVRRYAPLVLAAIAWRSVWDARVRAHAAELAGDAVRALMRRLGWAGAQVEGIPDDPPGTYGTSFVLATHPDSRADGAGRAIALLEGIHRECGRLGFRVTRAMAPTTNLTSHLLHTRLGWKVIGTARGHTFYRRETAPERPIS